MTQPQPQSQEDKAHGPINLRDLHRQQAEAEGRDPSVRPEPTRHFPEGETDSERMKEADEWWNQHSAELTTN